MDIYCAIDIRAGRCVRLLHGDYDAETIYSDDPVAQAVAFAADGALWIHVVDLDAARTGSPENRSIVAAVAAAVDVPVQTGGGVRSVDAALALRDAGVARVVVGTAAVEDPGLVEQIAAVMPLAVGLDVRDRDVAVRGWTERAGLDMHEAIARLSGAGAAAFVITQIGRDGALTGPDLDLYREAIAATEVPIVASGGVAGPADIADLSNLEEYNRHVAGVIVGKAIYEGKLTVSDALAAAEKF